MSEERGFEDALRADWYDLLNHRAYADWLEEHGSDDKARVHREWTLDKQKEAEAVIDTFAAVLSRGYGDEDDEGYHFRKWTREELIKIAVARLDGRGDTVVLGFDTPSEAFRTKGFWQAIQVVTGIPVKEGFDEKFVRCSC